MSENEFEDWAQVINRLPFVSTVRRDLGHLRRLLYERRPARICAVGLGGSGRTEIANALLSARALGPGGVVATPAPGRWLRIDARGRRLDWLELDAGLSRDDLLAAARAAFEETRPDLVLGVVAATEAEPAGREVAGALAGLTEALRGELADRANAPKVPILMVLAKADTLPPAEERTLPYSAAKRTKIDLTTDALRRAAEALELPAEATIAISAAPPELGTAARWNVPALADAILERLPDSAQLEAARAFEVSRETLRQIARSLVNSASALAVTVGLAPIPFADAILLLPLQAAMVTGVAYLSGRPWDRRAASEWVATVGIAGGAGMGLRWGARQLMKFVPGAGSLIGASIAGAGTLAMGRSAIAYFVDGPGRLAQRLELLADNP